jgi:transposase
MAVSDDLRERVVEAVVLGGLSRNQAAARFKVSVASAVRWVKRFKTTGEVSPAPCGGDRRSGRIEAHRDYLLGLIRRRPDVTMLEIRERLIANCGERFAVSVLWRFFDRHEITFKKKRRMPRSNNARTCKVDAGNGSRGSSISIRRNSFSLTRQEPPPISRAKADVAGAGAGCGRPSRTVTTKR